MLQRVKDLSWQAVVLILGGLAFVLLVLLFAPADVRAWILAPGTIAAIVAALHAPAYRAGSKTDSLPPKPMDVEDTKPSRPGR